MRRFLLRLVVCGASACQAGTSSIPEAKAPVSEPLPTRVESTVVPQSPEPEPARAGTQTVAGRIGSDELSAEFSKTRALATLKGDATYYGRKFDGRKTASGEVYDPQAFTAAHRKLPFGTVVRVKRVDTGQVVYVRITDRGPFGRARRIIDLSRAAAEELEMLRAGVVEVVVEVVKYGPKRR